MIRRGLMMKHKGEEYIKDGLVFWLDGRNQGGQTNKWRELIKGKDFLMENCKTTNNGVVFNGVNWANGGSKCYYDNTNNDYYIKPGGDWTLEICASPTEDKLGIIFIGNNFANFRATQYSLYTKNKLLIGGLYYEWLYKPHITSSILNSKTTESGVFADAYTNKQKLTQIAPFKYDGWLADNNEIHLGCRAYSGGGSPFKGTIHAIRIYNRRLTKAEIFHNQELDIQNYFGGIIE